MRKIIKKYNVTLVILFLFLVSLGIHFIIGNYNKLLITYPDELRYYTIAKSFYLDHTFYVKDIYAGYQKIAYSILIAPTFAIKNIVLRLKIINLINCILVASCVIPTYLIAKKCGLNNKQCYIACVFSIVWPETLITATFMAESLYWPLCLWFFFFWIESEKNQSYITTCIISIIAYIGYLDKEIFLAWVLAFIFFELFQVIKIHAIDGKDYRIKKYIFRIILFVAVFFGLHIILKLTIFKGYGNSYDQMGLGVLCNLYNVCYIGYACLYYVAAILLTFFILPIAEIVICYKKFGETCKKVLEFVSLFLVLAIGTIAYTISVREDLGRVAPRLHFRYLAPAFIIIIILCLYINARKIYESNEMKILYCFGIMGLFCLIFRGVTIGSSVDGYSLMWCKTLSNRLQNHSANEVEILYPTILFLIICISYYWLYKKIKYNNFMSGKIFCYGLSLFLILISIGISIKFIKSSYYVGEESIEEVVAINDYLKHEGGTYNVLCLESEDGLGKTGKLLDTYLEIEGEALTVDDTSFDDYEVGQIDVNKVIFKECVWEQQYNDIEHIDYLIVEKEYLPECKLANFEIVDGIGGTNLYLLKSLNVSILDIRYN